MRLADAPLAAIAAGDRVVSHTGMAGRIGMILPVGAPAPVDRILVLWASGKWSLAPHASMDRIVHDVEPAPEPPAVSRLKRLAADMKAILADMPAR